MPDVVGVRFKPCGKIYDFEANGIDVNKGDLVVVESELGLNIGSVVVGRHAVEDNEKRLKKIIRKAGEEDCSKEANKTLRRSRALSRADHGTRLR
jgi:cell fate regulator YaaT (PSP1 superfamily)